MALSLEKIQKGVTYLQSYNGDCEACRRQNRLMGVKKLATGTCAEPLSYAAEWDFAYDGDGVRMATVTTALRLPGRKALPVRSARDGWPCRSRWK